MDDDGDKAILNCHRRRRFIIAIASIIFLDAAKFPPRETTIAVTMVT